MDRGGCVLGVVSLSDHEHSLPAARYRRFLPKLLHATSLTPISSLLFYFAADGRFNAASSYPLATWARAPLSVCHQLCLGERPVAGLLRTFELRASVVVGARRAILSPVAVADR